MPARGIAGGTGDSRRPIDWQLAHNLRVTRPSWTGCPTANQAASGLLRGQPARPARASAAVTAAKRH